MTGRERALSVEPGGLSTHYTSMHCLVRFLLLDVCASAVCARCLVFFRAAGAHPITGLVFLWKPLGLVSPEVPWNSDLKDFNGVKSHFLSTLQATDQSCFLSVFPAA